MRSYQSYTSMFKSPYNFSRGGVNSDVSALWLQRLQEEEARKKQSQGIQTADRGFLDRTFDFLMTPVYGVAGFTDGAIKVAQGKADWSEPWKQAFNGVGHGLNVFSNSTDESDEYTFSRVLETAGWKPTSTAGKVTKGITGFGLDVLLDPTTYLTLGGSALVKGTGNVGRTASALSKTSRELPAIATKNTVERLVSSGVNKDLAERFASKKFSSFVDEFKDASHMSPSMAKVIVERQMFDRGFKLGKEELERDSKRFADEFNRISGIRTTGVNATRGISFGVEHMPFFGNKLSEKMGKFGKTVEITDGSKLRELGDKLKIANAYSGLRSQVYGRKLGQLFSTTAPLHKLAMEEPAKLYDFLKFTEYTKGMHADKIKADREVRDMAKAMNFSPAEQKEVLDLLQDKTVWGKVRTTVKYADTEQGKLLRNVLKGTLNSSEKKLTSLKEDKRLIEQMKYAVDNDLIENKELYKNMEKKFRDEIAKLDISQIKDKGKLESILSDLRGVATGLDDELKSLNKVHGVDVKEFDDLVKLADDEAQQWDDYYKVRERLRNTKSETAASKDSGKAVNQAKHTKQDVETVRDVLNRSVDDELLAMTDKTPGSKAKDALRGKLSKYIYGREDKLMKNMRPETMRELVDKVKTGASPEDLAKHIEEKAHLYSEHATEVYRFLAQKHNYKSWDEKYHKPMKKLDAKRRAGEALTPRETQQFVELQSLATQRRRDFQEFFEDMSYDEFKEVRRVDANERLLKELEDELDLNFEMRRSSFVDHDSALLNSMRDMRYSDQMEREMDGVAEFLTSTDKAEMFNDALVHYVQAQSKRAGKDLTGNSAILGDGGMSYINRIAKSLEAVVEKHFPNRNYQDLTQKQRDFAVSMAVKKMTGGTTDLTKEQRLALTEETMRRAEVARISAVVDTVKEGHVLRFKQGGEEFAGRVERVVESESGTKFVVKTDKGDVEVMARDVSSVKMLNKGEMTPEELITSSPLAREVVKQREGLQREIDEVIGHLSSLDGKHAKEKKELFEFFKVRASEQRQVIEEAEATAKHWEEKFRTISDEAEADDLIKHMEDMSKAITDDDAFETYVRMNYGEKHIEDVLDDVNFTNSARIALDDRASSETVKKWVETMYEEFTRMGEKEVGIGKLKLEQFEQMVGQYVPHILTPEGRRYIDGLDEVSEFGRSVTRDLGYGTKFNPYSQSRTIEGRSIEEINAHFAEKLRGKNLFSESIADIYVTRALKHTELMYDDMYMKTMMDVFGEVVRSGDEVKDGFKTVVNYGTLREKVAQLVQKRIGDGVKRGIQPSKELWDSHTKAVIKDLALPSGILDEFATPMVELNRTQLERLAPHGVVRQVNDAIVMKANQARKLQIAKDQSRMLTMYDKFLHWTKLNQTTVMPSFHVRNKMSNMYLNWLGVGRDAVNPRLQRDAWLTAHHKGDVEKLSKMRPFEIKDAEGNVTGVMHWNEAYELALVHGAIDEGFFAKDIGAGAATKGMFKRVPSKYDPTNTEDFILYKKGSEIGSQIENSDRLVHFVSMLKRGATPEEASASSKKYLFDYSDLTAFEQTWMKRIFPYYTWLRKNGRLQVGELLEQPNKYRDTAKVMTGVDNMSNEDEQVDENQIAPFARDWMQLPFGFTKPDSVDEENPNGVKMPVMANPNLPFMDISRLPNPLEPSESLRNLLGQMAPALKVPAELATNTNFFFDEPIVEEGDNQITPRLAHIARQLAMYNAGEGAATKDGANLGLHVLNNLTGLKGIAYDEQTMKNMQMVRLIEKLQLEEEKQNQPQ